MHIQKKSYFLHKAIRQPRYNLNCNIVIHLFCFPLKNEEYIVCKVSLLAVFVLYIASDQCISFSLRIKK